MVASWLANPQATRSVLKRYHQSCKHRLGQNFLVDDAVIKHILEFADLQPDDVVLEVGPGIGTLSVALLPRISRLVAIEADSSLKPILTENCKGFSDRLTFIWGDAIKLLCDARCAPTLEKPTKFVSNLPYQIAASIILKALEEMPEMQRFVVMVQAEVADRIQAHPATKAYGAYTAKLALWGCVSGRFEVPASCFLPAPHVQSAVVRIERLQDKSLDEAQKEATCAVIDAAFAQRRKTIKNSMSACGYSPERLEDALRACDIDAKRRAETLTTVEFIQLARALKWQA